MRQISHIQHIFFQQFFLQMKASEINPEWMKITYFSTNDIWASNANILWLKSCFRFENDIYLYAKGDIHYENIKFWSFMKKLWNKDMTVKFKCHSYPCVLVFFVFWPSFQCYCLHTIKCILYISNLSFLEFIEYSSLALFYICFKTYFIPNKHMVCLPFKWSTRHKTSVLSFKIFLPKILLDQSWCRVNWLVVSIIILIDSPFYKNLF